MTILFNTKIIDKFNAKMFNTLLYKHHLTTSTPKIVELVEYADTEGTLQAYTIGKVDGYFLVKDNVKYLLNKVDNQGNSNLIHLPISINQTKEVMTKQKDIVQFLQDFDSFSIVPEHIYSLPEIAVKDGIQHQDELQWLLMKIITWTAYCRRINVILSGIKESGKTSYPNALGLVTDKGYVVKDVGSVLGLSYGLSEDGYIVLDEFGDMKSEQRQNIRKFLYQQGEREIYFKTGKGDSAAHNLLHKYNINNLSCMLLCNLIEDYPKPSKFVHYMFSNSQAIMDRFLPLRINPEDTPIDRDERRALKCFIDAYQFRDDDNGFNESHEHEYIKIIKSLEWYKKEWYGLVDWKFIDTQVPQDMGNRRKLTYREILSGIYIYTNETGEDGLFEKLKGLLDDWYGWYYKALDKYNGKALETEPEVQEELVE